MSRTLLVTGGTGTLGRELVRRFVQDPAFSKVVVLTRVGSTAGPATPQKEGGGGLDRTGVGGDERQGAHLEMVQADLRSADHIGLSARSHEALSREVTDILHCAAATRFDLSIAEARAVNVAGTESLLRFAEECRSLKQVGCFSTVYVAGRRTGRFAEEDLENDGAGFVNTYEQSKNEMEQAVRSRMADLPVAVYRLSTLVGDSRTGAVTGFNAFHYALRLLYQGLAPMVPGEPRTKVDIVPIDYVADAAHWLFRNSFAPGRTYHLCSGPERSSTFEELMEATFESFERVRPEWRKRSIEKPVVVDLPTYELFVRSVEETGNDVLKRATRAIETFAYQLAYPKIFDAARTWSALEGSGLRPPFVLEYYPKVVRYCIETEWGAAAG